MGRPAAGAAAVRRQPGRHQRPHGGEQAPGGSPRAAAPDSAAGYQLRVYLATYGQGEAVWELFGHNALWIQDVATGETSSYNWGSFSFDQPGFVGRLIEGKMLYWLDVNDAQQEVAAYQYWNRSITIQELSLTAAEKRELKRFVEWNALPDNMYYEYHYFRDNCSTRVRDALDRVLGGQLATQLQARHTTHTFRSESLRLTGRAPLTYTGIELGLADSADHRLTEWEEAFAPMDLMRSVRSVQVSGPDGSTRPLVAREVPLFVSSRPLPLAEAPNRVPAYLALGVLIRGAVPAARAGGGAARPAAPAGPPAGPAGGALGPGPDRQRLVAGGGRVRHPGAAALDRYRTHVHVR